MSDEFDPETGEVIEPTGPTTKISDMARVDGVAGVQQSDEGVRARRAFMLKNLLPDQNWIAGNVQTQPVGFQVIIGRVWGRCRRTERKTNEYQGKMLESIALFGEFEYESNVTDQIGSTTVAYLPMQYAEKVAAAFSDQPGLKSVLVDCDIGLEKTAKPPPINYEWVVVAFREGEEMGLLRALRNSRVSKGASKLRPVASGERLSLAAPPIPPRHEERAALAEAPRTGLDEGPPLTDELAAGVGRVLHGEVLDPEN